MDYYIYKGELYHWGIKGMKWGVRRYQNKDGSLTKAGKKRYGETDDSETVEERRAKLLKSTDPDELYKNRSLLSTAEINERLNRIDTERRLGEVAAKTKKSGYERVDKLLKLGRKINEVYEFTNTPVMKELKKKLGITQDEDSKITNVKEAVANLGKISDKKLKAIVERARSESDLKKLLDDPDETTNLKDVIGNLDKLSDKKVKSAYDRARNESNLKKLFDDDPHNDPSIDKDDIRSMVEELIKEMENK